MNLRSSDKAEHRQDNKQCVKGTRKIAVTVGTKDDLANSSSQMILTIKENTKIAGCNLEWFGEPEHRANVDMYSNDLNKNSGCDLECCGERGREHDGEVTDGSKTEVKCVKTESAANKPEENDELFTFLRRNQARMQGWGH